MSETLESLRGSFNRWKGNAVISASPVACDYLGSITARHDAEPPHDDTGSVWLDIGELTSRSDRAIAFSDASLPCHIARPGAPTPPPEAPL